MSGDQFSSPTRNNKKKQLNSFLPPLGKMKNNRNYDFEMED